MEIIRIRNSAEPEKQKSLRFKEYFDYHNRHGDAANAERDPCKLIRNETRNSYFIAKDENQQTCGVSAVINHSYTHIELGGTRVTRNGLRLQRLFYWSSVFTEILQDDPPNGLIFLVCKNDNKCSIHNIEACGFSKFEPDRQFLLDVTHDICEERLSGFSFFCIPKENSFDVFKNMAAELINAYDNPDTGNVRIRFQFALLETPEYVDYLRQVSSGSESLHY